MKDIKVLIVSNSDSIRSKIEKQLSGCAQIKVVGAVEANEDALMLTWRFKPDVLVFHAASTGMPEMDLLFQLRQAQPQLRTLALECSPNQVRTLFIELAPWGLRGCICKWEGASELIDSVCTLGSGNSYLCPIASHVLVDAYRDMLHHVTQKEV